MPTRVIIADEQPIVRAGLRYVLERETWVRIVGEAGDGAGLLSLLDLARPDLLLLDAQMPGSAGTDGLSLATELKHSHPALPIVALAATGNAGILGQLRRQGVVGLVLKRDPQLEVVNAVRAIRRGGIYVSASARRLLEAGGSEAVQAIGKEKALLSASEARVIRLYMQGLSIREISHAIGRNAKTVSAQRLRGMQKLGLANDRELFEYALRLGMP